MENLKYLKSLIETRSDENCSQICNLLIETFSLFANEIITCGENNQNLIIGLNTTIKNSSPIILSGHIDTVKADETMYLTNPYNLVIQGDNAFGLGVIDMKCFFSSILDNIEAIKSLTTPIVICITSDEETKFEGIVSICNKLKELDVKPKYAIIGEPTNKLVMKSAKGCFEFKLEITGKSCHSSNPSAGINSICIAAKFIGFIEELSKSLTFTTLNTGVISGGKMTNQVPAECTLTFDIRTSNENELNDVLNKIKTYIDILKDEYLGASVVLTQILEIKPLFDKLSTDFIKILKDLNLEFSDFMGGCEAGYFQEFCDNVILFGAGDLSLAHKPNEFLNLNDYSSYNKTFVSLLERLSNVKQ